MQSEVDPDESEEEAIAKKKLKADKAASLTAKKKGNEHYSAKVRLNRPFLEIPPREPVESTVKYSECDASPRKTT